MSQKPILIVLLFLIFGCQNKQKKLQDNSHSRMHAELDIIYEELQKFRLTLKELYKEARIDKMSALQKAEKLIKEINQNPDPNHVKWDKLGDLYSLRAELYYRLGDYQESIKEIRKYQENHRVAKGLADLGEEEHNLMACIYVKLKRNDQAKVHLDSLTRGWYLTDYLFGNYQEINGNKRGALKIYNDIKKDKSIKHYVFYGLAIKRINELSKNNPKPLDELYYSTGDPGFEISASDDENRNKIFNDIAALPEVKNCKNCGSTWIYEDPQISDKDFYWVKVGNSDTPNNNKGRLKNFSTVFDFLFYPKNSELKVLDQKNNKVLTLAEWRKH